MQKAKPTKKQRRPYMAAATTRKCEAWQRFRDYEDKLIEQIDKRRES